ncbi:MAG: dihydrodipicolinate reductase [Haloplasmataceae bacterium]|jgi:4-hydroxy-tetrahydrodipicolinate reductase|nr:dihydrodipicolinate reductase [Haloplasmataceae bacterium]
MRKAKVKVAIWGFGAMGSGIARMILKKDGFEIVGVCDINPQYVNKSIYEILNIDKGDQLGVYVKGNIEEVVSEKSCDVVILATDSYTKKAFLKIKYLLEKKVNVISTAEEMVYPKANEPELAKMMDRIAKDNGVTLLGTGINPGMMMDFLVICLTGVMESVDNMTVKRINSLSPFGRTVMEEQGVGLSINQFNKGVLEHKIAGHVGFKESIHMVSDALIWGIDDFKQQISPIITQIERTSAFGHAQAGDICGVSMSGQGIKQHVVKINMIHPQQIEPELAGIDTGDYIEINGNPSVNMTIKPEVNGGIGTIAMCVNMIPHVINATPGLKTMIDLPVPRAIMGDVREVLEDD